MAIVSSHKATDMNMNHKYLECMVMCIHRSLFQFLAAKPERTDGALDDFTALFRRFTALIIARRSGESLNMLKEIAVIWRSVRLQSVHFDIRDAIALWFSVRVFYDRAPIT
ncbi:hypothetical protein DPMN_167823 [Dreissena polymorpha]|uniref:Uncharacterized protein n=1 Tax=Dreissena polymorpha TaxID=45954 RepID=A0A9D4F0Y0_DREPO|nr:hypothetical protein DPMN_167823 [Dreissena polymorpha]